MAQESKKHRHKPKPQDGYKKKKKERRNWITGLKRKTSTKGQNKYICMNLQCYMAGFLLSRAMQKFI